MTFLELSDSTARTARSHVPIPPPLTLASLSPSRAATALDAAASKELLLVDATFEALSNHLRSIAAFADKVTSSDAELAGALDRG